MSESLTLLELLAMWPWMTAFVSYVLIRSAFQVVNRIIRHLNIRAHGWPPAHCDADGDFLKTDYEVES